MNAEEYVVERVRFLEGRCERLTGDIRILEGKIAEMQEVIDIIGNRATIEGRSNGEKFIFISGIYEADDEYEIVKKALFGEDLTA